MNNQSSYFWTTKEIQTLRAMSGGSAMQVAAAIGRSPRAVQDAALRRHIPAPRQPHSRYWPATTKRRARRMRADGKPVSQISAALGVPFGTVRRWVYAEGAA